MKTISRFMVVLALVSVGWIAPLSKVSAASLDTTADRVFGQPNFTSSTVNNGGVSNHSLNLPSGLALDVAGNLYVADFANHRVLEYDAPLTADHTADRVFGQPGFTSNTINNGGVSAHSLNKPSAVALDAQGNLYIVDSGNHRVLEYDDPLTGDTTADRVFGQPGFTTNTPNNGGISASSLDFPAGVALDAAGNLFLVDQGNSRVLEYDSPLTTDAAADHVIGQPDFSSNLQNNGGLSAKSLNQPFGIALDVSGDLFVADSFNERILEYNAPMSSNPSANRVFGQPDFFSDVANIGGLSASSLSLPAGMALDAQGNLYVDDFNNQRLLEYDTPLTGDAVADRVFGQPDFISNAFNKGGLSASSLHGPVSVGLDPRGNLYVADSDNNRVLEYDLPVPHGVPALSAISPSTTALGSPAFTLTVNGSGYVLGSSVRWNGSDRPTTFLSSTQLNASISRADLTAGGPFAVTVFTPAPGGGTSALINFQLYLRSSQDAAADELLGQPGFQSNLPNNALLPGWANRLSLPGGLAVDPRSGRLFVADGSNHRVLSWSDAPAFANAQPADLVIGQPDFVNTAANFAGLSAKSLNFPGGLAVDSHGDLYVADFVNHRVLEYTAPLSNGMPASLVFGHGGSFTTAIANNGGVSANSLDAPTAIAVDAQGNLYVADEGNNRVLEYNTPLSAGATADRVFGQPDFTSSTTNNGGLNAKSLFFPIGVTLDAQGNLYVMDQGNSRLLEYDAPLTSNVAADRVFGQPDFTSNTPNNGGVSARSLSIPYRAAFDALGNLYVTDYGNNRVLEYTAPLSHDTTADRVFGQPDFTTNTQNNGGLSASSLSFPIGVALDAATGLYVADTGNQRVLEYDLPLSILRLPLIER